MHEQNTSSSGHWRAVLKRVLPMPLVRIAVRKTEQIRYLSLSVFNQGAQTLNRRIADVIRNREPAAIGKLGSAELESLREYLRYKNRSDYDAKTAYHRGFLCTNAGVYPDSHAMLSKWAEYWLHDVLPAMSHIGVWFNFNESLIIKRYARNAGVFHSYGLEPYNFENPWSAQLAGKRVVVVSPFEKTILRQYAFRSEIWKRNPDVLPAFDLRVVKAPMHPHLAPPQFPDWFAALDDLKSRIHQNTFDVLIVGAGAYSLPLCAFAKSLGKVGIHLGGNTQLLFGVLGKRWLVPNASIDHRYFNDAWIYPLTEETPNGCGKVENACYWK